MGEIINLAEFIPKHRKGILLIYAIIFLTGIIALQNIPLEKIPEASFPKIYVRTMWSASPENIELFLTSALERELAPIKGVDNIESYSYENFSSIVLEFTPETKMDYAYLRVNEVLYQTHDKLPEEATYPIIVPYAPEDIDIEEEFISFGIFSDVLGKSRITSLVKEELKPKVESVDGVSGVKLIGVEKKEVRVEFDEKLIKRLNISLFYDLLPSIRKYHEIYSVGNIEKNKKNYLLLVKTDFSNLDDLKRLNISTNDGRNFRLNKLAKIRWAIEEEDYRTFRLNGNEVIKFQIYREPGSNVISLTNKVKAKMSTVFESSDFANLKYQILKDTSEDIKENIYNLLNRIIFVVLIICFVLLLFFHKWRPTLTVIATIFFEVLITINALYILGESLNYFSLTGMALAFGMLVDNAIVVYSNIHHYQERGQNFVAAMKKSFKEIRWAIIAATLTNICVFFPFIYLQQEIRRFMIPFAITVGVALVASILVSFTFIPIALMKRQHLDITEKKSSKRNFFYHIYGSVLKFFLRHRAIPLILAIAIFIYAANVFIKD
ncbi:MAG: efflux RND transporter permease subunit, partial [Candidatus Cloacimonetes bacterium]|nr:efflux RND transporter permease subunit [Candidatus Cloacimonadota bacterium]